MRREVFPSGFRRVMVQKGPVEIPPNHRKYSISSTLGAILCPDPEESPMPHKTVYSANIDYLQILDENAVLDEKLAKDTLSNEDVQKLYEFMIVCRQLDEIAFKLQRSGRMGTYPQNKGQEAAAIGSGFAARKGEDFLVPCYRENAALF